MDLPIKIALPESFLSQEVRCDYTVSSKMKAVWAVELDLYKELERVCNKYNLKLFGFAGTILGAVRHKGFIPWDDDMDIGMSRDDYEVLCQHASEEFKYPYYWDSGKSTGIESRGHGQLKNSLTTCILKSENSEKCDFNQGIFIDVFPYDNIVDDDMERVSFLKHMATLNDKMMRYKFRYIGDNRFSGVKKILKSIQLKLFRLRNRNYENRHFEEYQRNKQKYNDLNTDHCVFFQFVKPDNLEFLVFEKTLFTSLVCIDFESYKINIPSDYNKYLQQAYGEWKKIKKTGTMHGGTFFDPYKSYEYYINHRNEVVFD